MRFVAALALLSLLIGPPAFAQEEAAPATDEAAATPAEGDAAAEATPTGDEAAAGEEATAAAPEATSEAAPAPEPEAAPEPAEEPMEEASSDDPSNMERIIVSSVAGAVAVAGLAVGITFGVLAQQEYACLDDIVECNKNRDEKIEGEDYLDARAEVERKALYADMGYLVAVTAATIAIVGAVELLFGGSEAAE